MGRKFSEKEAKEYLLSLSVFANHNRERLLQIMELRSVVESCTVATDKESIQSSGSGDKMANIIGKIVDLEREMFETEKIIKRRRLEFEEIAKNMHDGKQRAFLTIRYYDGNGFYDTAMMLDLKDTTAKRIHRHALTDFTRIYNERHG